jgi:hypothetical protein
MNCFLTREFKDEATELLPFISFVFLSDAAFSPNGGGVDVVVDDILFIYVSGICGLV